MTNKLSQETIEFLTTVMKTAQSCGIDSLVIDKETIRGQSMDQSTGVFMLDSQPYNDIEFDSIGIGRVNVLLTRINFLNSSDIKISFDIKNRDNGDNIVSRLYLSNDKTKVDYNCIDPYHIKAPKKVNDIFCYSFVINEETLKLMSKCYSALNLSHITFSSETDGSIKFRASDVEGDRLDHLVANTYSIAEDADKDHFFFKYSIKLLLPLLKAANNDRGIKVSISKRGFMRFKINGLYCYILGEV